MANYIWQILFWLSIFLVLNAYLFYPIFIILLSKLAKRKRENEFFPALSILIAAYNEEKVIEERLKNIAELNYDLSKIEVLVGSDNSSDRTNDILKIAKKKYTWLKVYFFKERSGKAGIMNKLISEAKHEIIVFSDANTIFDKNALLNLTPDFYDKNIGGICGRLILKDENTGDFEGVEEEVYWKLETFIKRAEGKLGILIGANGGIFAIRKSLFTNIPTKKAVTDDLFISLQPLTKGYKVIYNENALAFEPVGKNVSEEFNRKVRFSATNFQTLVYLSKLLSPLRPLTAYAFFSHKVLRWTLPFLTIILFISNLILFEQTEFYKIIFFIQLGIYGFAFVGWILSKVKIRLIPFSLIYFFVISNVALFLGFLKFLSGKHSVIWERTSR